MTYTRKNPISDDHQNILNKIGKKVFELREAKKLSIERFSAKNDIPRISYSNLESGKNFHLTTLLTVLDAHNIQIQEFFKTL